MSNRSNILFNCFESIYSLNDFLIAINLRLSSEEMFVLDEVLDKLSNIFITFDFKLETSMRSCVDMKLSYEQMLLIVTLEINRSKLNCHYHNMFKINSNSGLSEAYMNLNQIELKNKLLATENVAICYFLSDWPHDGFYWRKLYSLTGWISWRYVFLYGYIFRGLKNTKHFYVQISGQTFNSVYLEMVDKCLSKAELLKQEKTMKISRKMTCESLSDKLKTENEEPKSLKTIFDKYRDFLFESHDAKELPKYQLQKLGHKTLGCRQIMYGRNFSTKIPEKYIYSQKTFQIDALARSIFENFISKNINFSFYKSFEDLNEMKASLVGQFRKFVFRYRTCDTRAFLSFYCMRDRQKRMSYRRPKPSIIVSDNKENEMIVDNQTPSKQISIERSRQQKRKRMDDTDDCKKLNRIKHKRLTLQDYVDRKNVYCFTRRCLMHVLGFKDKGSEYGLVGGLYNFKKICKFIKKIFYGCKYDSISLNKLLNGLKLSKIAYLTHVKDDRYKRLILMSVLLWIMENYVFVLIRSNFYVTDTSLTNFKLYFYLKEDWKEIVNEEFCNPLLQQYKKTYNLEIISDRDAMQFNRLKETAGVYLSRLLPKNFEKEFRIISGTRAINLNTKRTFSINYQFITLHQCLKYLVNKFPSITGFACASHADIRRHYSNFLNSSAINRTSNINNPLKKWNFIKVDIQKCFDSINVDSITTFLNKTFDKILGMQNVFTILKYNSMSLDIDGRNIRKKICYMTYRHNLNKKGFFNGIADFIESLEAEGIKNVENMIYVPVGIHERNIELGKLNNLLNKCLKNVIMKIHNKLYVRLTGILHGSIVSRLLCDIYLGMFEMSLFTYDSKTNDLFVKVGDANTTFENEILIRKIEPMILDRTREVILRVVDDYLVICDDELRGDKIKCILESKLKFNEKKNVKITWSQPMVQTEVHAELTNKNDLSLEEKLSLESENSEIGKDEIDYLSNYTGRFITWNGLNIDVYTLDMYLNYDKYFNVDISNRITNSIQTKHSYFSFNLKFLRLFDTLSSTLLLNPLINHLPAIIRNIIDFFALTCIRYQIMYKMMPDELKQNVRLQHEILISICTFLNTKLLSKLKSTLCDLFSSSFYLFKYICMKIFIKMFNFTNKPQHNKLKLILEKNAAKFRFENLIKSNNQKFIVYQIETLIDQQVAKFEEVIID